MTIPSPNGKPIKISFKKLFFPTLLLIAVVIVFFKFSEIREIGNLFMKAHWGWLFLAFISQSLNVFMQSNVYSTTFNMLGLPKFSRVQLIKTVVTVFFLNFTIPSLGFAGNLWFLKKLKNQGIPEGKALLIIVIEFLSYYAAFITLVVFSLVYLTFRLGELGLGQKIATGALGVIFLFILFCVYFFLGNKQRAHKRILWLANKIDKAEDGISQEDRVKTLLAEFYENIGWLKNNKRKVLYPAFMHFIKLASDGLTIMLIFLAFGELIPLSVGVVAFTLGRLFGLVTLVPGGLGTFDGSMVLVLKSLGSSLEISVAVMLVYRFFSYWLYFPFGIIFYKQLEKAKIFIQDKTN